MVVVGIEQIIQLIEITLFSVVRFFSGAPKVVPVFCLFLGMKLRVFAQPLRPH